MMIPRTMNKIIMTKGAEAVLMTRQQLGGRQITPSPAGHRNPHPGIQHRTEFQGRRTRRWWNGILWWASVYSVVVSGSKMGVRLERSCPPGRPPVPTGKWFNNVPAKFAALLDYPLCPHRDQQILRGDHQAPLGRSQHWQCKWLVNNPIRKQSAAAGEPHITISATNRVKLISHTKLTFGQRQTDRNARYLAIPIQSTACIKMVFVLDFLIWD